MGDVRIKYKVDKGELVLARKELDKINKEIGVTKKQSNQASGAIKAVGGAIIAAFTIDKLVDFGRQIISITAEFDKLRAVLTNTLGSKSQADAAFTRLQEFASKTPFQVSSLTNSFVKLANQGFVPTNKELTKLGDLAASTGKDFDQLTEAIIDAQTGEFERLKEFGIRASKQGDQVTFAFKGVQTQTEFTSDSIKEYLLSLGELEGVSGAMEAVSKTLGGQISNLQDNFDSLFYALGQASVGIISDVLSALNAAVETVARLINAANGITGQASIELNKLNLEFGKLETAEQYQEAISVITSRIEMLKNNISENITQAQLLKSSQSDATDTYKQQGAVIDTLTNDFTKYKKGQEELFEQLKDTQGATEDVTESTKQNASSFADANTTIAEQGIQLSALEKFLQAVKQDYFKLTSAIDDGTAASEKFTSSLIDTIRRAQRELNEMGGQTKATIEEIEEFILEGLDELEQADNEYVKSQIDNLKKVQDEEARILEERAAKKLAFLDAGDMIASEVFSRQQQRLEDELNIIQENTDKQIEALEIERDRKLEIVGRDAEARKAIEKKFQEDKARLNEQGARKEKEIAIKQAKFDRVETLFQIAVNTAEAVIKSVAASPLTAGQPFAGIAVALGALQAGLVASRPLPKFRKGVLDIQGPSHERGGILAEIEGHESIMTANETRNFMPTLKAIRENSIDPEVLNQVAQGKGSQVHNNIVEVPRDQFVWDEDGFSYYMNRKNITVQRKGMRYKC